MSTAARAQLSPRQIVILAALADALGGSRLDHVLRSFCTSPGCASEATQLVSSGPWTARLCTRHAREHLAMLDKAYAGGPM